MRLYTRKLYHSSHLSMGVVQLGLHDTICVETEAGVLCFQTKWTIYLSRGGRVYTDGILAYKVVEAFGVEVDPIGHAWFPLKPAYSRMCRLPTYETCFLSTYTPGDRVEEVVIEEPEKLELSYIDVEIELKADEVAEALALSLQEGFRLMKA